MIPVNSSGDEQLHVDDFSTVSPDAPPALISVLPPELLSQIVEAVATSEPPRSPVSRLERDSMEKKRVSHASPVWNSIIQGGSLGWMRLGHVCRLWRDHICEGMPLLWAQSVGCFRYPGAVEEMLRRAGEDIPLSLRFGPEEHATKRKFPPWSVIESPVSSWSQSQCMAFRSRIQSLQILDLRGDISGTAYDRLISILNDLPSLRNLDVHCAYAVGGEIPENILSAPNASINRATTLRKICLTNYFIPWTQPGLTHLSIAIDSFVIPGQVLLELLSLIAPTIVELALDYVLPVDDLEQDCPRYTFPELRCLYVRDLDECIEAFLRVFQHTSLAKLKLALKPTRDWRSATRPAIKNALVLLRQEADPHFGLMAATSEHIVDVDGALDLLRGYVELGFSRDASGLQSGRSLADYDLALSTENPRYILDEYGLCLAETRDSIKDVFPTIWDDITVVNLNLPLRTYFNEMVALIGCLTSVRELRIADMLEHLDREELIWSTPFFGPLFATPSTRLDVLWVVQSGEWEPELVELWCSALGSGLKHVATSSVDDENRTLREQSRVGLLRLDLVETSDAVKRMDEGDLVAMLMGTADQIDLRFL